MSAKNQKKNVRTTRKTANWRAKYAELVKKYDGVPLQLERLREVSGLGKNLTAEETIRFAVAHWVKFYNEAQDGMVALGEIAEAVGLVRDNPPGVVTATTKMKLHELSVKVNRWENAVQHLGLTNDVSTPEKARSVFAELVRRYSSTLETVTAGKLNVTVVLNGSAVAALFVDRQEAFVWAGGDAKMLRRGVIDNLNYESLRYPKTEFDRTRMTEAERQIWSSVFATSVHLGDGEKAREIADDAVLASRAQ